MAAREVGVLPPARRRQLFETAMREFATSGYERASLNRIIRTCGMSKSSFYHYFASKDALFDALVADVGGTLVQALDPPRPAELGGSDFWARIGALVDRLMLLSRDDDWFVDLGRLFYLADAPSAASRPLGRARAHVETWLDRVLDAGRSVGAVRDDLPRSLQGRLTLAVLGAMDEWSVQHLETLDTEERSWLAAAQLDAIRRLLAP